MSDSPPASIEALREAIMRDFDTLSPRMKQVGRHLLDEPNDLAFETLATISTKCGVQPSTIVRFAQQFGFDGAAPMQRVIRDALLREGGTIGYSERIRQFSESVAGTEIRDPSQLLTEFVSGNIHALENLSHALEKRDLQLAVDMIASADTIFVLAVRRAFPVAIYLGYLLAQAGKRMVLVDGVAGMANLQVQAARRGDLAIAISFNPYAPETAELVEELGRAKVPVLAISDSVLSPVARAADLTLLVREIEVRGFRSIAASMCLVQTLAIFFTSLSTGSSRKSFKARRPPKPAAQ